MKFFPINEMRINKIYKSKKEIRIYIIYISFPFNLFIGKTAFRCVFEINIRLLVYTYM